MADNGFEIVGVIDDLRNQGPARDPAQEIYVPFGVNGAFAFLIVETRVPPQGLERTVRAEVYALDSQQPVTDVRTLDAVIDDEMFARPRFSLLLLGVFAAVGLLLAVVGVYGIVAYSVAQQRAEFGVRLALGATRADVLRLVLGRGLRLMALGTLTGLAAGTVGHPRPQRAGGGRVAARSARLRRRGNRARRGRSAGEPAAGPSGGALESARGPQGE